MPHGGDHGDHGAPVTGEVATTGELASVYRAVLDEHDAAPGLRDLVDLSGRVALVTGGGGPGIGQACCVRLAGLGASVHVNDIDGDLARDVARRVADESGVATSWSAADASDHGEVERAVATAVDALGPLDVLVNTVGGGIPEPDRFDHEDPSVFESIVRLNLLPTLYFTHAVLPSMLERGSGSIVNVSSEAATIMDTPTVYGSCKAGVDAFTKLLADQVGRLGVRVNSVRPGNIATAQAAALIDGPRASERFGQRMVSGIARTAMRRPGHPREIADVVAFLSSPAASYVNGATIRASGGLY